MTPDHDGDPYTTSINNGPDGVNDRPAAKLPKKSPKEALDEMVNDPQAVRARCIEELRAEGLSENQIREEMALIETTLGI